MFHLRIAQCFHELGPFNAISIIIDRILSVSGWVRSYGEKLLQKVNSSSDRRKRYPPKKVCPFWKLDLTLSHVVILETLWPETFWAVTFLAGFDGNIYCYVIIGLKMLYPLLIK